MLGSVSLLADHPPLCAVPVPVYRDYVLRREFEEVLGPRSADELYEQSPYVIEELARARIEIARHQATPAELRWEPKPSLSFPRGFVLAAYLDERMIDLNQPGRRPRRPSAHYVAVARRLGISRDVARRVVRKHFRAVVGPEGCTVGLEMLFLFSECMATVDDQKRVGKLVQISPRRPV